MGAHRLLFLGDVVGEPGRSAIVNRISELKQRYNPQLTVVNGENAAGGLGITERIATKLLDAGVDVLTTGNHVYRHAEVFQFLDTSDKIVRPANYLESNPGRGYTIVERDGFRWAIVNLAGTVFLADAQSPFHVADRLIARLNKEANVIVVDFHAEATSEKVAMGWHLDGRVGAVLGTHTHVPTADGRVLPGGTAYISDVGMTGSRTGVIGVKKEQILQRFLTQMPVKFETATGDVWIMGCVIDFDDDGKATAIEQVLEPVQD